MAFFFTELSKDLLCAPEKAIRYVDTTLHQVPLKIAGKKKGSIKNCAAEEIVYLALANKLPQPKLASEDTVKREKALLSTAMQKQYVSKTGCFKEAVKEALSSLSVDEKLISERFTYLEKKFKWMPKYTAVFTRRTTMSEYSLCIPGYLVRLPSQVKQKTSNSQELIYYEAPPIPKLVVMPSVKGLARNLAMALVNGTEGNKVGALILDKILPSGTPDYFDSVYKEIEKIINQQLTQNTIDERNGEINAAVNWVKITYTSAKESQLLSTKELTALLLPGRDGKEPQLESQMVGVLMSERYAEPSICTFMIGAGMHLSVLQELAYVDLDADSPAESKYVESIKDYAKLYAEHAKTTTESIMEKRSEKIVSGCYVTHSNGSTFDAFYYEDTFTGKKEVLVRWYDAKGGQHDADANRKRDRSMQKYRNEVLEELKTDMADPVATANEWLKLVEQPLPPSSLK